MNGLGRRLPFTAGRGTDDELSRRTDDVLRLVERLVFDVGMMTAGHAVAVDDYVDPSVALRLRTVMRSALDGDLVTRPDFGEYAEVRIEADPLDETVPVRVVVEFDDRSVRVDARGQTVVRLRRQVRLRLLLDPEVSRIMDLRVELP